AESGRDSGEAIGLALAEIVHRAAGPFAGSENLPSPQRVTVSAENQRLRTFPGFVDGNTHIPVQLGHHLRCRDAPAAYRHLGYDDAVVFDVRGAWYRQIDLAQAQDASRTLVRALTCQFGGHQVVIDLRASIEQGMHRRVDMPIRLVVEVSRLQR